MHENVDTDLEVDLFGLTSPLPKQKKKGLSAFPESLVGLGVEAPVDHEEDAEHEENVELGPASHAMFRMLNCRTVVLVALPLKLGSNKFSEPQAITHIKRVCKLVVRVLCMHSHN